MNINIKGFTLIEVILSVSLIAIVILAGSLIYSKRVADTSSLNIVIKDISQILSYYEQNNCSTTIPPGCNSTNPFGYNYTITCGGNNRTTIVTTTLPSDITTIPIYPTEKMFCYKNLNNLICYNIWTTRKEPEDLFK